MPTRSNSVESELTRTAQDAACDLALQGDGPDGLRAIIARAGDRQSARPRYRRIWLLLGAAALGVVGAGGVATAYEGHQDGTTERFRQLHPDKRDVDSRTVEPHALAGTVTLRNGNQLRLSVTTAPGTKSCADVQQLTKDGRPLASVGFCGDHTKDSLQMANGGIVGYVMDDAVTAVKVSGPTGTFDSTVTYHYYLLPPEVGGKGIILTVTGYRSDGRQSGEATIKIFG